MNAERIEALAAGFWERVGAPAPFPRDLEQAISLAVPASVVRLEDLRPTAVHRWLLRHGIRLALEVQDRPLDGCIFAHRGAAVIFLAAGLEAARERVVLAHELGHFLGDYEWPRNRALGRLGRSVLPVLDGERPFSKAEALAGVLAGLALGAHVHYLERGFDPRRGASIRRVERTASEIGCALLAPRRAILAAVTARGLPARPDPWGQLLQDAFGFPEDWARLYAVRLLRRQARRRTFSDFLGL